MKSTIKAEVAASVWKVEKSVGDVIAAGDTIMILESMKMEIPVEAEEAGTITTVHVAEGEAVDAGQPLAEIGD